jgi:glutathione S-transferase
MDFFGIMSGISTNFNNHLNLEIHFTMPMTLEYWDVKGFGNRIREMAFFLSLDLPETRLKLEDGPAYFERKNAMGNLHMNLPGITDGDVYVSETPACVVYLLEKAGRQDMMNNNWQREMVNSMVTEMSSNAQMSCYTSPDMAALLATLNPKFECYAKFQMAGLAKTLGSKPFLFGDQPVLADFTLADFLDRVGTMDTELAITTKLVKGNSTWEGYQARFLAIPKIKEFRASDKFMARPFNGWNAVWF